MAINDDMAHNAAHSAAQGAAHDAAAPPAAAEERRLAADFAARVERNQRSLQSALAADYDYIVCGAGPSGAVVARRLAENPACRVLLLDAGSGATPDHYATWSRGHRSDWDYFADCAADPAWNYVSTLATYRRIEDWHGTPDAVRRGSGGLLRVQAATGYPSTPAMLATAARHGSPTFADQNGVMMEGASGAALSNVLLRDGVRLSVFDSYVRPLMVQSNLTVLTGACVTRVLLERHCAIGVELAHGGKLLRLRARHEVILALGAIRTPTLLMQSGIGEAGQLQRHGIAVLQHLPGVGQNYQAHIMAAACVWELAASDMARSNGYAATVFHQTDPGYAGPDLQLLLAEVPFATPELQRRFQPPAHAASLLPVLLRPLSRGAVTLTGARPEDAPHIEANTLADPEDLLALMYGIEMCREIGNDAGMRTLFRREVMPGKLRGLAMEAFVRAAAAATGDPAGTARMGRDEMAVVDAKLRVYGIERLRIADASVLPRITTGNTTAPCVVIGERLGALLTGAGR